MMKNQLVIRNFAYSIELTSNGQWWPPLSLQHSPARASLAVRTLFTRFGPLREVHSPGVKHVAIKQAQVVFAVFGRLRFRSFCLALSCACLAASLPSMPLTSSPLPFAMHPGPLALDKSGL